MVMKMIFLHGEENPRKRRRGERERGEIARVGKSAHYKSIEYFKVRQACFSLFSGLLCSLKKDFVFIFIYKRCSIKELFGLLPVKRSRSTVPQGQSAIHSLQSVRGTCELLVFFFPASPTDHST